MNGTIQGIKDIVHRLNDAKLDGTTGGLCYDVLL